jgi:tRNA (mo5U34)-methyltransferase
MPRFVRPRPPTPPETARRFVEQAPFVWHQRFELVPGVFTPGAHDIEWLVGATGLGEDLEGRSVLDIGTANGGAAFLAERRGARRVVAVDIYPPDWFGVGPLIELLGSKVEYLQASVYDLPSLLDEPFDVVLFLGVLYHLRHPLLALDAVRAVCAGEVFIETQVADHELPELRSSSLVRFYRGAELADDPSNWFAPTVAALLQWCESSGLRPEVLSLWPPELPSRCLLRAERAPGEPEFERISYERLAFTSLPGAERG